LSRRRLDQTQQTTTYSGFAATGFAHQPERFPLENVKGDAVDRAHNVVAVLNSKMLYETPYGNKTDIVVRQSLLKPFCLFSFVISIDQIHWSLTHGRQAASSMANEKCQMTNGKSSY
jgi:hypothetical protein